MALTPLGRSDPREIGGYQLTGRLGSGGMGVVFLGSRADARPAAVKVMRPELGSDAEFRTRFRREVDAARKISGKFTAQLLDADPEAPSPWLATAYVPGPSLSQAVRANGPLPAASVKSLLAGVAQALTAIHAAGLIHRDLKPSNVLLAADGPRVIDFGIVRAVGAASVTRTGKVAGSLQYMAPEQARGEVAGPAVDIWALGALGCFAATGHSPFGEGTEAALMYRLIHDTPKVEGCPREVYPVIAACLDTRPGGRPSPARVIEMCRPSSGGKPEYRPGWLPPAHTAHLAGHVSQAGVATRQGRVPGEAVPRPDAPDAAGSRPDAAPAVPPRPAAAAAGSRPEAAPVVPPRAAEPERLVAVVPPRSAPPPPAGPEPARFAAAPFPGPPFPAAGGPPAGGAPGTVVVPGGYLPGSPAFPGAARPSFPGGPPAGPGAGRPPGGPAWAGVPPPRKSQHRKTVIAGVAAVAAAVLVIVLVAVLNSSSGPSAAVDQCVVGSWTLDRWVMHDTFSGQTVQLTGSSGWTEVIQPSGQTTDTYRGARLTGQEDGQQVVVAVNGTVRYLMRTPGHTKMTYSNPSSSGSINVLVGGQERGSEKLTDDTTPESYTCSGNTLQETSTTATATLSRSG